MSTPSDSADRDLLFGLIALQLGLVTRDTLLDAMHTWAGRKDRALGQVLQERGAVSADTRRAVEAEVEGRLARQNSVFSTGTATVDDWRVTTALEAAGAPMPMPNNSGPRYRKSRRHRRGGVGEVYVAVDTELGREVALKEIQAHLADRAEVRRRFLREALITGGLEHPGVVPVYGLGHGDDGRPYYAMRFIKGESLEDAIRHFHAADATPHREAGERELTLRSLLSRFVAVCNAIAYAHSRGVVHRDMKPANIMLGEYGETLVVDWGLAKRTDEVECVEGRESESAAGAESGPTEVGRAVGTPAFMPPEQARGEWDRVAVPSDVFALGATLYTLLCGKPPYDGPDALTRATEAAAPPARLVNRRVPAALSAVCQKAMAPRPEDRYASAQELAGEVERWLADEPVQAYREPAGQRLLRWARQHQPVVTGVGVLLLAGVVGLGLGLAAVRAEEARTKQALAQATDAGKEARQNWGRAEANLARARKAEKDARDNQAVAETNARLAKQAVDECFGIAKNHHLLQAPNLRKVRNLLLEQSLGLYQNFLGRGEPSGLEREVADHHTRIGFIHEELGDLHEALRRYQAAGAALRRSLAVHPDHPAAQRELAWALLWEGYVHRRLKTISQAQRASQDAVGIGRHLVKVQPDEPENRHALASALSILGSVQAVRGKAGEARTAFREGVDLLRPAVAARGDVRKYQANLSMLLQQLGDAEAALGNLEQAERFAAEAVEGDRRLVRAEPEAHTFQVQLTIRLISMGFNYTRQGKGEPALRVFGEAIDLLRRVVKAQPDVPIYQCRLAKALELRAAVQVGRGKVTEARQDITASFELLDELEGRGFEPMEVTLLRHRAHHTRAQVLLALDRPAEALADCDRAAALTPHGVIAVLQVLRAQCLARMGECDRIAADAAELSRRDLRADEYYQLARLWALSAGPGTGRNAPLPLREKADARAALAVAALDRAAEGGYFDLAMRLDRLDTAPELAAIRDRDDYRYFRAALRSGKNRVP